VGWIWMAAAALASDPVVLVVVVEGLDADARGMLRCAAFVQASGFPMNDEQAVARAVVPASDGRCVLRVPPGPVAVAVGHDRNGNGDVDTNLLGIPKEAWAVSNDVRPRLRAPTFAEARREVSGPDRWTLTVVE